MLFCSKTKVIAENTGFVTYSPVNKNSYKESIISRLNARGNSTEWAYMQVDRCDKAFKDDYLKGKKIDTNNKNVDEVCNNLIKIIYG